MSRRLAPVAGGVLLAAVALVLVLALAPSREPTAAELSHQLATELRCPDCEALSVADSQTRAASGIRAEIARLVGEGRGAEEIRAHFVERYGEWILLAPRTPLAWLIPAAVVAAVLIAFGAWLGLRRGPVGVVARPAVDDAARRRVREEAEAIDG